MIVQLRRPGTIRQWAARRLTAPTNVGPHPPSMAMLRRLQAWGELEDLAQAPPLRVENDERWRTAPGARPFDALRRSGGTRPSRADRGRRSLPTCDTSAWSRTS